MKQNIPHEPAATDASDRAPEESNAAEQSALDLTPKGQEPGFDGDSADAAGDVDSQEASASHDPGSPEALREQLDQVQRELQEQQAKLLRTAADYQNYIRRSQLNIQAEKQATLMKVAKALVGVLDNFDRAMELDPAMTSAQDVQRGAATIQAALLQALESFGLKRITVEPGQEFDPNLHEALMRQPSETIESDHVAMQFLPGYLLNDQPVRPAQVSVAE